MNSKTKKVANPKLHLAVLAVLPLLYPLIYSDWLRVRKEEN